MAWVRLDDCIFDNPKIAALSDAAQLAHIKAIVYCSRGLTNGDVPMRRAKEIATSKVIKELVPMLWEPTDAGFRVHDYLEYNPTREQVLKRRQADSARKSSGIRAESGSPRARAIPIPIPSPTPITPHPAAPPSAEQVLRERPNIFRLYEQLFGKGVSPLIADRLKEYETTHTPECIEHCFQEAAESNARNLKLVYTILDRHQAEGCYAERPGRNGNGLHASEPAPTAINWGVPYEPAPRVDLTDEERQRILDDLARAEAEADAVVQSRGKAASVAGQSP